MKALDTLLTKQLMEQDGRVTTQTMLVNLLAGQQPRLRTMLGRQAGAQHVVLQSQSSGQLSKFTTALRRLVRQQAKQQSPQRSMLRQLRQSLQEALPKLLSGQLSKLMTALR